MTKFFPSAAADTMAVHLGQDQGCLYQTPRGCTHLAGAAGSTYPWSSLLPYLGVGFHFPSSLAGTTLSRPKEGWEGGWDISRTAAADNQPQYGISPKLPKSSPCSFLYQSHSAHLCFLPAPATLTYQCHLCGPLSHYCAACHLWPGCIVLCNTRKAAVLPEYKF